LPAKEQGVRAWGAGEPIARGRDAEVYALGDGRIERARLRRLLATHAT
jgi:hypothetical protein